MRPTLHRLLVLLILAALIGGCGGSDAGSGDDAGKVAPTTETTEPDGEPVAEKAGGAGVVLEDAGATPRQELRFAFKAGDTFRAAMIMKIGVKTRIDGQQLPTVAVPAMRIVMSGRIDEVTSDGMAKYSFAMDELNAVPGEGADPAVVSQIDASLSTMKGLRGTGSVDRVGNAGPSTVDTSKVTDPTVKNTIDSVTSQISNLTVPFPTESVGAGARWKAQRQAVINGITTDTTSTYSLKSLKGTSYELDVLQQVTAPKGPVTLPGMPAGSTVEVVSYRQENSGSITGDLKSILPTNSRMAGGGDIEMSVVEGGKTQKLLQTLTLEVSIGAP